MSPFSRRSRHLLLAVGLVNRAGGYDGLLEALHAVLYGTTHVPAHDVGAPVPVEANRIIDELESTVLMG